LDGVRRIWLEPGAVPQYYPLTFTSLWLEHHLWGVQPLGYHLVNVLLHGANAILVWVIGRRLALPGAWLAAAMFAVHPVHVESVAWVAERKNVLSGARYLAAFLAYLRAAGGARAAYGLALGLFAGAPGEDGHLHAAGRAPPRPLVEARPRRHHAPRPLLRARR